LLPVVDLSGHVLAVLSAGCGDEEEHLECGLLVGEMPAGDEQPCGNERSATRRRRNALADLEDFWNYDKHRTLEPVASAPFDIRAEVVAIRDCEPLGDFVFHREVLGHPIEGDTEVYSTRVRPTGHNPKTEVDCRVDVLVTFCNGLPVLDILPRLGNWVGNAIAFWASEFESPRARRLWGFPRGGWIEDVPIRMKTTIVRKNPSGTWTRL
jgi:hypothetical protein